ncbi:MAG: hypothetical protein B7Z81_08595 [Acidocella sp. 20-61-6]|nr:MAG: hypothetical protein B7Z81_08595 [Acidocella sp. 20-61-6]
MIHRRTPRSPTAQLAQLIIEGAHDPVVDCHIVEISAGGVRVVTGAPIRVPETLVLRWGDGAERKVRRRWVKRKEIGLEFIANASEPPKPKGAD